MSKPFALPKQGFVFWPVGTGDSSTIVAKENELVMQIDLHHSEKLHRYPFLQANLGLDQDTIDIL